MLISKPNIQKSIKDSMLAVKVDSGTYARFKEAANKNNLSISAALFQLIQKVIESPKVNFTDPDSIIYKEDI